MQRTERVATQIVFKAVAWKNEWRGEMLGLYRRSKTQVAAQAAAMLDYKRFPSFLTLCSFV